VRQTDQLIAFWDGRQTGGTWWTIAHALGGQTCVQRIPELRGGHRGRGRLTAPWATGGDLMDEGKLTDLTIAGPSVVRAQRATCPTGEAPAGAVREAFLAGRLTEKTRRAYRQDLDAFFTFTDASEPRAITADRITAWRNSLMDAGLSPATVSRKLTSLRAFCEHLVYHEHLTKNPADPKVVRVPKVSSVSRTQGLTYGQAARLLEAPDRTTLRGARDYAILKWLLHLGLRREELCRVTLSDLGEERGHHTVRVKGKGGKDRLLPVRPSVWAATVAYLDRSGRALAGGDRGQATGPVFTPTRNPRGGTTAKALTSTMIWYIVARHVKAAGIKKRITPHSLRHTAITLALDAGATIRQAQTFAGHADPKTTVRYDRTREDLDKSAAHLIDFGEE
jgi:integrase/recombinase XerD